MKMLGRLGTWKFPGREPCGCEDCADRKSLKALRAQENRAWVRRALREHEDPR